MTVKHMRIDNRLIHGQVAMAWLSFVGANCIIVVNDQVAKDPIQKMLLPKAARGVKTLVLSVDDAVAYVSNPENTAESILMIAKFPSDALQLLEKGLVPEEINVGNQAPIPGTKYKMVTHSIAVTADDAKIYRALADKGYTVTSQMVPSEGKSNFIELLAKKGM